MSRRSIPTFRLTLVTVLASVLAVASVLRGQVVNHQDTATRVRETMKRATAFMVEKASTNGGYVWSYLPDLSRRWGEMEARDTMIWIQPPGTPTMGHLFLDAYHATGDEYYCRAAERVAEALIWGQHPAGGWNYMVDFAGDRSLRDWYDTVGRNGWRLEEFQHYWGNATFDDEGTAESAKLLLRVYLEKRDAKYRPALDKAIRFVLDSQYPIGAWPQRFPLQYEFAHHGSPDYTSYLTFNDDVARANIDFLILCYQALGDARVLDAITRAMNAFLVTQQGAPQPGWALQYTTDLKPAGARTYEPKALVTHTSAANLELLIRFYRLTGETKFLARIPEALDWLDSLALAPGVAPEGRTHPTFIEIGTNRPLYVHREGSNVVNGRYYADYDPRNTIVHYSSFRKIDVARLRKLYAEAKRLAPADAVKDSPLVAGAPSRPLPRFFTVEEPAPSAVPSDAQVAEIIARLDEKGAWIVPLGYDSHPYHGNGSPKVAPGDFSQTYVGDESDTSPYKDDRITGISTEAYIRNMGVLIRYLEAARGVKRVPSRPAFETARAVIWELDNLDAIGGRRVTVTGTPHVVESEGKKAVEFNGTTDGLFLDVNPLAGLARFAIEVTFAPAPGGNEEQRFVHFEEQGSANRALIELRTLPNRTWCLDTYLRYGPTGVTLIDRAATHPAAGWHVASLIYDGTTMWHAVDGVREASGPLAFKPLGAGRTSIGVRADRTSWFKGRIAQIRVTPDVVTSRP